MHGLQQDPTGLVPVGGPRFRALASGAASAFPEAEAYEGPDHPRAVMAFVCYRAPLRAPPRLLGTMAAMDNPAPRCRLPDWRWAVHEKPGGACNASRASGSPPYHGS
ncbi:hypothetical protein GCM10022244_13260 [Streptomyces gulbargensis]|uniref:Uncharacterized protein n=1 Tax=Streptomyces gulbargensis TaxID=364901 RepID=A0ABP7LN80_9ACTN